MKLNFLLFWKTKKGGEKQMITRKNGYAYDEIHLILNAANQGNTTTQISKMLDGKRSSDAVSLVLRQWDFFNGKISKGITSYEPSSVLLDHFEQYQKENVPSEETKKAAQQSEKNSVGIQHQLLVDWFTEGEKAITAYVDARIAEGVAEEIRGMQRELEELRAYKNRISGFFREAMQNS